MVRALLDGLPIDSIPYTDSLVVRGDGCFEAVRSYGGRLWQLEAHLDRLARSATAIGLGSPDRDRLSEWAHTVAGSDDGIVRILLSRGDAVAGADLGPRCLVFCHPLPDPKPVVRLAPESAPWHPAGRPWPLAGIKTTSYAPNVAATRAARDRGFDDALLVSEGGLVLEGPTFCVAWVVDGRIETPSLDLGILASITRACSLEHARALGIEVVEGRWRVDRLAAASEVFSWSTVKEVCPVVAVGDRTWDIGPVMSRLAARFREAVSAHAGTGWLGQVTEGA